jgi:hypothetical protein
VGAVDVGAMDVDDMDVDAVDVGRGRGSVVGVPCWSFIP